MNLSESKDFPVNTASLKEVRVFSRDVFEKISLPQEQKEELVLAIAEAAQNIVKHAYKGVTETNDKMEIKISLNNNLVYSIQKIDIVVVLCQLKIKMINIFYTK